MNDSVTPLWNLLLSSVHDDQCPSVKVAMKFFFRSSCRWCLFQMPWKFVGLLASKTTQLYSRKLALLLDSSRCLSQAHCIWLATFWDFWSIKRIQKSCNAYCSSGSYMNMEDNFMFVFDFKCLELFLYHALYLKVEDLKEELGIVVQLWSLNLHRRCIMLGSSTWLLSILCLSSSIRCYHYIAYLYVASCKELVYCCSQINYVI